VLADFRAPSQGIGIRNWSTCYKCRILNVKGRLFWLLAGRCLLPLV
jgi:hypothetical protein